MLVVVALVTGVLALRQSRAADRAALAADARRVGTAALTQQDPQGSLMRAIAAARLDESDASLENLHALLASYPQLIRTTDLEVDRTLTRILATPEGLIVLDRAHGIHLVQPESLQALARGQAGTNEGDIAEVPLAYSNREHVLAVASQQPDDLPIRLLDAETLRLGGRQLTGWPARPVGVNSLSVSGNGRYLAAAMTGCGCPSEVKGWIDYAVVKVWDLRTRRLVQSIPLKGPAWLQEVALDKTGRRLFLSGPLRVYAVSTGRRLWELTSHFPVAIAVQRHGGLVAADSPSGGTSSSVEIRKSSDGSLVTSLEGLEHGVTSLQFSHDGSLLAASGYDGLAIVWDVATQQVVDRIDVGGQKVTGITFSPDDRTLYTAAEPGHQVSSWDLTGRRTFLTRVPLQHSVGFQQGNARISHDGTRILRMSQPDRHLEAGIIDVAHDRTTRAQTIPTFSYDAASWAPDDTTFALGYPRGVVALLDGRTGHDLVQRPVLHSLMTELSFSADGRHLLGTDVQGEVVRLDSRTLVRDGPIVRVPEHPYAIASSPDGTYGFVIAGGTRWAPYLSVPNRHFYLVDFDAHRIVRSGPAGVENAVSVDYSPNGKYVTVGGRNGEVAVIDVTTGKPVRPAVVPYSGDSFSVRYNHDGSLVTTASTASQLALLDGETGQVLATAALPPTEGTAISNFAPDGTIVVYTALGHVFRWDPSSVRALDFACSITGRGLSPAEWETVFSGRAWRETCPP